VEGAGTVEAPTYLGAVLAGVLADVAVDDGAMPDEEGPPGVAAGAARAAVLAGRVPVTDHQVVVQPGTERTGFPVSPFGGDKDKPRPRPRPRPRSRPGTRGLPRRGHRLLNDHLIYVIPRTRERPDHRVDPPSRLSAHKFTTTEILTYDFRIAVCPFTALHGSAYNWPNAKRHIVVVVVVAAVVFTLKL
jgi:hypothetical protein